MNKTFVGCLGGGIFHRWALLLETNRTKIWTREKFSSVETNFMRIFHFLFEINVKLLSIGRVTKRHRFLSNRELVFETARR